MISVKEASAITLSHLFKPGLERIRLDDYSGQVLAEDICADRDLPPFDRVTMDGIALTFDLYRRGKRTFGIEDVQAAGEPQKKLRNPENAIEVMTGAMLPAGTDTVIRYEDLTINHSQQVTVKTDDVQPFQSIHKQGQDAKKGSVLLRSGTVLSPAEIALLASVGKTELTVKKFPKTAIISSGDELVSVHEMPLPHQIRRSNAYAIQFAMKNMGWPGTQFHLTDNKDAIRKSMETILNDFDTLILSGGVSQGKFDFIPSVLEELGVQKLFHQVRQRPGKPFYFGVASGKTIFALPGNPVSTFMCFYRYIKPWVLYSLSVTPKESSAVLAADFTFKPELTYFLQVRIANDQGRLVAYPDAGGGSGDFANLRNVDGFLELPAEKNQFRAGETYSFIPFRR